MSSSVEKMLKQHRELVQSDNMKVLSHVQRQAGEWLINTLMVEGCDVPFKYRRQRAYRSLKGQRVNMTYYRATETVAGFEMEVMKVVRVKVS